MSSAAHLGATRNSGDCPSGQLPAFLRNPASVFWPSFNPKYKILDFLINKVKGAYYVRISNTRVSRR